ncbi:uncharacterized protein LOC132556248 [Ylistrum balloti]|uniref:uncharacterized protein LOC132556248 n=1 Tax=Ylistrum balloti TaxID=509963 RepID=UPI002905988F|nr:uncharacterized protein LOC132556248 [Ylistrum balloti]
MTNRIATKLAFRNLRSKTQVHHLQRRQTDRDIEDTRDSQRNALTQVLRPLFLCMTLSGTFDHWKIQAGHVSSRTLMSKCLKCYRITMLVLYIVNACRYFPTYLSISSFGPDLLTKLMVHLWYLLCILNGYACYKMVEDPKRLTLLLELFNVYHDRFENEVENFSVVSKVGKITSISMVLGWFFNIGNVVFAGYMLYTSNIFDNFIAPFTNTNPMSNLIKALYLVIHLFLSCTWIFTCIATMIFSLTLYFLFKQFVRTIEKLKSQPAQEVYHLLERYRKQHNALCDMIDVADDTFSLYVAFSLTVSMLLALMLLYNICWYNSIRSDPGQLISHIFWLMAVLTNLGAVAISTGMINHSAHEPLRTIYNMSLTGVTADFSVQVNVFLQRLNGAPIGLSAFKLVMMDKHTFIQIGGVLATYFVVLLQFQQ